MASPIRTEDRGNSRLGALTPIVQVIKNAQSNASRDFDRFYDNLWSKVTPKNNNVRIRDNTKTPERARSDLEDEDEVQSTSLTPLIERHKISEVGRYDDFVDRNPFYQHSEIGETPELEAETPYSYSRYSVRKTPLKSPRRSVFDRSTLNQKIEEERRRMDKLQESITRLRRQSSLLAEEPSGKLIFEEDNEEDEEEEISVFRNQLSTTAPPRPTYYNHKMRATTPKRSTPMKRHLSPTHEPYTKRIAISPVHSTYSKRMAVSPVHSTYSKRHMGPSSIVKSDATHNNKRFIVSPKRIVIDEIPAAKLRSTELIRTPGGSMVSNRFWKEIHGNNSPKVNRPKPITGRISTLKEKATTKSKIWENEEDFWSSESSSTPVTSSFNDKLLKVAQQEEETKRKEKVQRGNDMVWSKDSPVSGSSSVKSFRHQEQDKMSERLMRLAKENGKERPEVFQEKLNEIVHNEEGQHQSSFLSEELAAAKKRDEIIKRNHIPVMPSNLLAELKAKYQSKLIDDSDEYKFS